MAAKKPGKCPSCRAEGALAGPEPYTCLRCGYVVTPEEDTDNG